MGKKKTTRNKRRGHKVEKDGCSNSSVRENPPDGSPAVADHPNKLISNLRSTDRSIRHSTLAALLHTSFHASALSAGFQKNHVTSFHRPLLQAIRDQVVACDPLPLEATAQQIASCKEHLRCSILATECLGNYLCYADEDDDSYEGAWVAGWFLIFMQRIQDFVDYYAVHIKTRGMLPTDAHRAVYDLYLDLVEQCVIALVHLFERNPLAMDRLLVHQPHRRSNVVDIHGILTFLLQYTHSILTSTGDIVTTRRYVYQSVQLHAARCLHSIWDDNFDFIVSFLVPSSSTKQQSESLESTATLEILQTVVQNALSTLTDPRIISLEHDRALYSSIVTGLHSSGACVAAWMALQTRSETTSSFFECCIPMCVQLVGRVVMNGSPDQRFMWHRLNCLEVLVSDARLKYCREQKDSQMEEKVLQQQYKKLESARSIARRLKQMKASTTSRTTESISSTEEKVDHKAQWEEMQIDWYDAVRPIELAVELIVNWASPSFQVPNCDVSRRLDDDVIMDDGDGMTETPVEELSIPSQLVMYLKNFQVLNAIRELFTYLTDWYKRCLHRPLIPETPVLIIDSLADVIFKTITAMENCHVCESVSELAHSDEYTYVLWNQLKSFLFDVHTVTEPRYHDMYTRVQTATTGTMVALLRRMSQRSCSTGKAPDPEWLRGIFKDVSFMLDSKMKELPYNLVFVRDAICMSGILVSSFPNSMSFTDMYQLTHVLKSLTVEPAFDPCSQMTKERIPLIILSEVLDVFMDVFSEDDFYPDVFEQLEVLFYFERMIPMLKQEIQWSRSHPPAESLGHVSVEDMLEHCQETLANANRFVKYKKNLRRK